MQQLQTYHWPGNIRELKNCVERMVILTGDSQISLADLPDALVRNDQGRNDQGRSDQGHNILIDSASPAPGRTPRSMLAYVEEQAILDELLKCGGNVLQTARSLGIARSTLYRKLKVIHRPAEESAGDG
jgi:transcriptional regulator of acetoin/glycerol metabolism